MKIQRLMVLAGALALFAAAPARAATIGFDACTQAELCGDLFANVAWHSGGTLTVYVSDVDGLGGIFGSSGGNRAFGFNVVGSTEGLVISGLDPEFSIGPTDRSISGYGEFEFTIDGPATGSDATLPLFFTLSRDGGFSSALDLFEVNAAGYIMAAHLRDQSGLTGFVAATTIPDIPEVPEPASMTLLGLGLAALARKRQRAS